MAAIHKIYENIKVGRPSKFESPSDMWEKALRYFDWCENNNLNEVKVFNNQGEIVSANIPHMRAMTSAGLYTFLNVSKSTWYEYKEKEEFTDIISIIESVIYEQKFSGAAAGLLNSNIIARDLGLSDKTESKNEHKVIEADDSEW